MDGGFLSGENGICSVLEGAKYVQNRKKNIWKKQELTSKKSNAEKSLYLNPYSAVLLGNLGTAHTLSLTYITRLLWK